MSVETVKLRNELFRDALTNGWYLPSLVGAPYINMLPTTRIERWYSRLYGLKTPELPGARLINHFRLGADPEFAAYSTGGGPAKASGFNMKAGLAFGADNNGRLVELRPAPSRSALSVLTSIWLTLRWMALYHPDICNYNWRSGAYTGGDGLGGHVHFGRKQTIHRESEINSLDRITHLCFIAGIFNREEGRLRYREARGAQHGDQYGRPGDIRLQPHGYEYRTMPSWLDNPWLAYFILTITKLVVAMPELLPALSNKDAEITNEIARGWLRLILSYFAPLDDDARLAQTILGRIGFPTNANGLDFKNFWGIYAGGLLGAAEEAVRVDVIPTQIPSNPVYETQLMRALLLGVAPECQELTPTWTPIKLPKGYVQAIVHVDTTLAPNLGEFTSDLAFYNKHPVAFGTLNRDRGADAFWLPKSIPTALRNRIDRALAPLRVSYRLDGDGIYVHGQKEIPLSQLLAARNKLLKMRILPVWRIQDVTGDSFAEFQTRATTKHRARTLLESVS